MPRRTATTGKAWYSISEVAEHYGIATRTVWRMIARGELRAHRIGKTTRVHQDQLAALPQPIATAGDAA